MGPNEQKISDNTKTRLTTIHKAVHTGYVPNASNKDNDVHLAIPRDVELSQCAKDIRLLFLQRLLAQREHFNIVSHSNFWRAELHNSKIHFCCWQTNLKSVQEHDCGVYATIAVTFAACKRRERLLMSFFFAAS